MRVPDLRTARAWRSASNSPTRIVLVPLCTVVLLFSRVYHPWPLVLWTLRQPIGLLIFLNSTSPHVSDMSPEAIFTVDAKASCCVLRLLASIKYIFRRWAEDPR